MKHIKWQIMQTQHKFASEMKWIFLTTKSQQSCHSLKKYKQKIIVKIYKEIFTIFANEEIC